MKRILTVLVLTFSLISCSKPKEAMAPTETHAMHDHEDFESPINWRTEWSEKIFKDAKSNKKLILLSLEARWCHWCHVMKGDTYQNKEVAKLLNDNFITIRVDHDANANLATRYKKWGWPATIMFNSKGEEIVKRAGYIEPENMVRLLTAVIKDPSPENEASQEIKYSKTSFLSESLKDKLVKKYYKSLDKEKGGLNIFQKNIDRDTIEYGLSLENDEVAKAHSIKTLRQAIKIMDKEWGGFYQYSTFRDWDHPHYEKLAKVQSEYLRIYSLAQLKYPDEKFSYAIDKTISYLDGFLTDSTGAFYSSQDADLVAGKKASDYFKLNNKQRRAQGIPAVDKNIYAEKNGRMIEALALAYKTKKDEKILARAIKATEVINSSLRNENNSYKHGGKDEDSYLSDNLFMAKALLALYEVTADRKWLDQAKATGEYIIKAHRSKEPGYVTKADSVLEPVPDLTENIKLARLFNNLSHYSGKEGFKEEAKYIMQYLASESVISSAFSEPGILLVDQELAEDPIHFTIVGSKKDKKAQELYQVALSYPSSYIRIEWYDAGEGKLMNHDVEYPELPKAAAFSCANRACSLPIFEGDELLESFEEV